MERDDPRFTAALVSSSDGRWGETIRLCSEVLAVDPLHLGAGNLLASALHMLRGERDQDTRFRLLSVLFVDVGGSTRLTTLLGPEVWRKHLLAIQSVVARSVARYEGYIHNYEGDAVLCSFSFPRSHEDDARRAVLCALTIVEDIEGIAERINADSAAAGSTDRFSVRVGIDTGRVVVGPSGSMPTVNATDLVGDAVNFAARLQHCATRTGVVISDRTLAFVGGFFHTEPEGPVELRGFTPQVVHHVDRSTVVEDRLQATAHRTPLIGRREEVDALESGWTRAVAGERVALLLCGDAGVGKSRLAETVVDLTKAASRPVLELRCSSLMRASAFGAIGAMLQNFLRLDAAAGAPTPALVAERLQARVGDSMSDWMPGVIGRLIGVGVDEPADLLPDELRARSFEALIELLAAAIASGPVVILVEDVHEADPSTLELLRRLQANSELTGYLVLMTSRRELEGRLPHYESLEVGPLRPSESSELVSRLLGEPRADAVAGIAARCDGIPLYAEELCLRGVSEGSTVPDTLEALLMSRLDSLDGDALAVAEAMAVVALEITDDAIVELVDLDPERVHAALGHLLAERVVVTVATANQATYRFRHALVQAVAYERILQSARSAGHARCADMLMGRAATGLPVRPELIAEHHLAAGAPMEALTWWIRAGQQAAASAAHDEAADHFERALGIVWASEPGLLRDSQEFELCLQLGLSRSASRGYASPLAFQAFRRAQELTVNLPPTPSLIPAVWGLWSFHLIRGDLRTAATLADDSVALAAGGDQCDRALGVGIVGTQRLFEGRFEEAVEALELGKGAVGATAELIPQDPQLAGQSQLAIALWHVGRTVRARAEMADCVAAAEAATSPRADFSRAFVFSYAAWLHELIGDSEGALELATAAQNVAIARHFSTWQLAAHLHIVCARGSLGFADQAVGGLTAGLHLWREVGGSLLMVPYFLARRGWAHLALDDHEAAARDAREGLAVGEATGQLFHTAELLRLLAAVDLARGGAEHSARDLLGEAERTAAGQGANLLAARAVVQQLDSGGAGAPVDAAGRLATLDDDPLDPTFVALSRHALQPSTTPRIQ